MVDAQIHSGIPCHLCNTMELGMRVCMGQSIGYTLHRETDTRPSIANLDNMAA